MARSGNGALPWAALRCVIAFCLAAPPLVVACSGESNGSANGSCTSTSQCTHWACTCNDGTTPGRSQCINHVCGDESICVSACQNHGGLLSAEPEPTVKGTAECNAFCAKIASIGCGKCNADFWCLVEPGECEAQKRAQLQCKADTGKFECIGSNGWSLTDSCPSAKCPADAGTDSGTDSGTDATSD